MSEIKNLGNVKGPKGDPGSTGPAGPKPTKTPIDVTLELTEDTDANGNYIVNSDPLITGQKYLEITISYIQQTLNVPYFIKNTTTMVGILSFANYQGGSKTLRCAIQTPFDYSINKGSGQQEITAIKLIEKGTYWS